MYSSCLGYVPSKKQCNHNLSVSMPHNFSLQRSYSKSTIPTNSYTNHFCSSLEMSRGLNSVDAKHSGNHFTSRTQSIMSFVYTLGGSSRLIRTPDVCKNMTSSKSRHNCKELVVHYNNIPSMPLVSSHLIGGFVGSKSQLGRTQGFEVKMWDIIRDLLSLVSSSSTGKSFPKSSPIDKRCCGNLNLSEKRNLAMLMNEVESKELQAEKPRKQSYAEVTKSKLPVCKVDFNGKTTQNRPSINLGQPTKMKDSVKKGSTPTSKVMSVIETLSKCSIQNITQRSRDRITSECSADSEDSFIVFENENCESDVHVPDDISSSSDDESCHINGVS